MIRKIAAALVFAGLLTSAAYADDVVQTIVVTGKPDANGSVTMPYDASKVGTVTATEADYRIPNGSRFVFVTDPDAQIRVSNGIVTATTDRYVGRALSVNIIITFTPKVK